MPTQPISVPSALQSLVSISHHGAVNGVTGSCHQLHLHQSPQKNTDNELASVLIDCGLFQGAETAGSASAEQLEVTFDLSTVQALLVTHCHIDHVGRIPYLLAAGFTGPIIATEATAALLPLVIEDALKVGVTRNVSIINACLKRLKRQLVAVPFKQWHTVSLGDKLDKTNKIQLKVKFQPAGHILGSAYIEIDVNHNHTLSEVKKRERVIFSGDLGAPYSPLLPAVRSPYKTDILVIESTYGDKNHHGRKHRSDQLKRVLEKAVADNGIVIIPAFSIGRTQELLYELEHIIRKSSAVSKLSGIEVIVDSPMAAKFTEYYRQFKSLWDAEAGKRVSAGRHPLSFDELYTVNSHKEHLATIDYLTKRNTHSSGKPAIVIAASGMCAGGRVVNYLRRFLPDATADVIFVGYQANGTPGRAIQKYGARSNGYVIFDGKRIDIKAGVHTISGYSAHADQKTLVNFVKRMKVKPKEVVLVHGDDEAKQVLAEKLNEYVEVVRIGVADHNWSRN
jgi:metallo-beta-lactamase family protein